MSNKEDLNAAKAAEDKTADNSNVVEETKANDTAGKAGDAKEAKDEDKTKSKGGKVDAKEKAKDLMKLHGLKEVHMTSDGQFFSSDTRAKTHASTLKDKIVKPFKA